MEIQKNLLNFAISMYLIYSDIVEKKHAKIYAKFIRELGVELTKIEINVPIKFRNTVENLRCAVEDEREYFKQVAKRVRTLAEVEKHHFTKFSKLLETGKMFKRDENIKWMCLARGYVHKSWLCEVMA